MVIWAVFACLSTAMAGVVVTLPSTDQEVVFEDSARTEIEAAMEALAARQFEEAARRFGVLAEAGGNADMRYLEAVSRYEAGDVHLADAAIRAGLSRAPSHGALLALHGIVLAELGRGDDALSALELGLKSAPVEGELRARMLLHRGVVRLDRGEAGLAEKDFREARGMAERIGAADVVVAAEADLGLVAELQGRGASSDALSVVSDRLRRGDVDGAKAAIPTVVTGDRRSQVRALLAEGNIARAEGRFNAAVESFERALALAEPAGLVREASTALAQIGVVHSVSGRYELAREALDEALLLVEGTSLQVITLSCQVEAGRVAVRLDDLAAAQTHLAAARAIAAKVQDPLAAARIAELEGLVADRQNRVPEAAQAYDRAYDAFVARSQWMDAARVACSLVEALAGRDAAGLVAAKGKAETMFAKASDALGPAHVLVAEGLGRARRNDDEGALRAFVEAAQVADGIDTSRARQVAAIARENAAQILLGLGHSAETVATARDLGLAEVMERQQQFFGAKLDYEQAMVAYDAGRYAEARDGFDRSWRALVGLGESGYALKARRSRAWSDFNLAAGQEPATAFAVWQRLVDESLYVYDPELRARSMAAVGLAALDLERPEATLSLRSGARAAEEQGLPLVAGQCFAALAEAEIELGDRLAAARRAMSLRDRDKIAVYAMYSVTVDAYNAEQFALAVALADEILPVAGDLENAIIEVRAASVDALAE